MGSQIFHSITLFYQILVDNMLIVQQSDD
uniref:Uncharacterized protein n=1 Tax=Arundo donax TaxID=35708 RepID=A0A0A8Z0J9_ARUDO